MLKKIILIITIILSFAGFSFADDIQDVRNFFNSYVSAANNYSPNVPNFYLPNAKIIRVVHKKDGTIKAVPFPMIDYANQMRKSSALAKTVGYKNNYLNIKITPQGNDYKISAMRYPRSDKIGLPVYFVVTKTSNGYKIKEESMDTNVQDFLKYAK